MVDTSGSMLPIIPSVQSLLRSIVESISLETTSVSFIIYDHEVISEYSSFKTYNITSILDIIDNNISADNAAYSNSTNALYTGLPLFDASENNVLLLLTDSDDEISIQVCPYSSEIITAKGMYIYIIYFCS